MTVRGALAVLLPWFLFVASAPSARSPGVARSVPRRSQGPRPDARAVGLLEYAVSQRPQPGRDVVTYGTNVERQLRGPDGGPDLRYAAAEELVLDLRDFLNRAA